MILNINSLHSSDSLWTQSQMFTNSIYYPYISQIKNVGNGKIVAIGALKGAFETIISSEDNGKTWNSIYEIDWDIDSTSPPPNPFQLAACSIVNKDLYFTAFQQYIAIKKHYKGKIDTIKMLDFDSPRNIFMKDENLGIITDFYKIRITQDGWKTFDTSTTGGDVYGLNILQNNTITCLTKIDNKAYYGIYNKNTKTWDKYLIDTNFLSRYQYFVNDTLGWVLSQRPTGNGDTKYSLIHKTIDGGKTWRKQLDTTNLGFFGVQDIKFKDENIGVASAQPDLIFETKDGGETWKTSRFNSPNGGNGQFVLKLEFTDDMILLGTDYDGIWRRPIFPKTDVEQFEQISLVFPNPSKESFTIKDSKIPQGKYNIKIISQEGIVMLEKSIEYNGFYQIQNDLQKGMYIWQLQGPNNFYGKIIKE